MENKDIWLESLITATPQEGRELAIKMARKTNCGHTDWSWNQKKTQIRLCQWYYATDCIGQCRRHRVSNHSSGKQLLEIVSNHCQDNNRNQFILTKSLKPLCIQSIYTCHDLLQDKIVLFSNFPKIFWQIRRSFTLKHYDGNYWFCKSTGSLDLS